MNKLTALSKLAGAWHYVVNSYPAGSPEREAQHIMDDKFGYVRRSLRIQDLAPVVKVEEKTEGLNPIGPKFF